MRRAHSFVIAAAAAAIFSAVAAPAAEATDAVLSGYDTIAAPGAGTTLRVKVEAKFLFVTYHAKGAKVEFRANGALLGSAVSGDEGYADLKVNAPATPGDVIVTGHVTGSYHGPDTTLLLAVRDAAARVVIVDVDYTLSNAGPVDVLIKGNADLHPVKGAVSGLNDVAKDATVVYVTARDDHFNAKTHAWLALWGFPRGAVFLADHIQPLLDPASYKTPQIRFIHAAFTNMPCGFGDLPSDCKAYNANGLASYIFDTHSAGPYPAYAVVSTDWDDLRAKCAAGQRPELSWARSFR